MTMEITKFSEKDMNAAISMARQTWHGYYDEFRAEYILALQNVSSVIITRTRIWHSKSPVTEK